MTGVLDGLKVLEMGHVVAVPGAATMMAEWGADVIKIEPLAGELYRGTRTIQGADRIIKSKGGEVDWIIQLLNRSKRSLALDLKQEAGRNILYKLVRQSDVFLSNYELGALEALKADYATLSRLNPGLIYGILTGYGTTGPDKDERGFDYSAAWARSGMQFLIGEPGGTPPPQRPGMMDMATAGYLTAGILAALLDRQKTGKGQKLEISLYHTAVWLIAQDIQGALVNRPIPKHEHAGVPNPLWNNYRTKDNRWLQLVMLQSDLFWGNFCRALGHPELEKDPRFLNMNAREVNNVALIRRLDEIFASRDANEWQQRLKAMNCVFSRVASPAEVIADPQALANSFFSDIEHPAAGQMRLVNPPVKFPDKPAAVKGPAPEVGQDTEDILLELGYGWEDIALFKDSGIIR